jgi:hypothetical protein
MIHYGFARLLPLLCAGCVLIPTATLAGSVVERPSFSSARVYGPSYWPQAARPHKPNLHLYLNTPGNTVRILDGGNQIVSYDRECRIYDEVVPSARGPHSITVTRC